MTAGQQTHSKQAAHISDMLFVQDGYLFISVLMQHNMSIQLVSKSKTLHLY